MSKAVLAIQLVLELIGLSEAISKVVAEGIPTLVALAQKLFSEGHTVESAKTELQAALSGIEAAMILKGEQKFGPG